MTQGASSRPKAMEGGGFYNRNSALQAANVTSALPLLEEAARSISLDGNRPAVIVDYGASQGRNSLLPMRLAIAAIRERNGADRPVEVIHTDLASNDFQALFTLLAEDPSSYMADLENVFPSAIGRSYYEQILPDGRADLGWSSNALHWMNHNPVNISDHGWAAFSASSAARDAVDKQLEEDWRAFLLARSAELRPGAKLVCQFMGRGAESHGFEWMADLFWQALVHMGRDGLLSDAELLRMTCASAGRSVEQIEAPFQDGVFAGLRLTHVSTVETPDPFWDIYCQNHDADQLGRSWALVMRAANGPTFAAGLDAGRDADAFLDALTGRLAAAITRDPQPSKSYLVLVALEKIDPGGCD